MAILTEEIIKEAARKNGIDPCKESFAPKDLKLDANKYGAFADYCDNTKSSKYNERIILTAVEFNKGKRPMKYLLIK